MNKFRMAAAIVALALASNAAAGEGKAPPRAAAPGKTVSLMTYSLARIKQEQRHVARQDAKVALGELRTEIAPKVASGQGTATPSVKSGS